MNDFCLFCLNETAFPIAQTDFFDRKNAFYDHDFTTEVVVLGNQSVRDRRLIGRAVIIITEKVFLSFFILNSHRSHMSRFAFLSRVVQEVDVFHYKENPFIEKKPKGTYIKPGYLSVYL